MQDGKPVIYDTKRFRSDKVAHGTKIMDGLILMLRKELEIEVKLLSLPAHQELMPIWKNWIIRT